MWDDVGKILVGAVAGAVGTLALTRFFQKRPEHASDVSLKAFGEAARPWVLVVITVAGFIYVAFVALSPVKPKPLGYEELVLLAILLLFNSDVLGRLGKLVVSGKGIEVHLQDLREKQGRQGREIQTLRFLIGNFLTGWELDHLRKLAGNAPFPYGRQKNFDQELRRLRDLGFIAHRADTPWGIRRLPQGGGDLRDFFRVTERGLQYLDLRRDSESEDGSEDEGD